MNKTILSLVATLIAIAPGNTFAQTDFFWSLNGLNQGAVNADLSVELAAGATSTAYLYYTTNGPADSDLTTGAFLDLATSQVGIIQFTNAETLDFNIELFFNPVGVRWGDSFGATAIVFDDAVDELSAFTFFTGSGIMESQNGSAGVLDTGYDAGSDSFLFAKVDFTVIDDPATAGATVDVITSAGAGGIVSGISSVPATFGGLEITVGPPAFVLGDFTGDGVVSMADVGPFVQAIISNQNDPAGDINQDSLVNLLDIRPFVDLMTP